MNLTSPLLQSQFLIDYYLKYRHYYLFSHYLITLPLVSQNENEGRGEKKGITFQIYLSMGSGYLFFNFRNSIQAGYKISSPIIQTTKVTRRERNNASANSVDINK